MHVFQIVATKVYEVHNRKTTANASVFKILKNQQTTSELQIGFWVLG